MIDKIRHGAGKVASFALVILFVALGILGILLPILPGLVFLLIAALIASRHYPALAFVLERNRYSRRALRYSNSFMDLGLWDKCRLGFWATIKLAIDGLQCGVVLLKRLGRFVLGLLQGARS